MVQRMKSEGTASRVVTAPVYCVYFDYGTGGVFVCSVSPYRPFPMTQRWVIGITPIYRLGNIGNIPEILVKNIQPANI